MEDSFDPQSQSWHTQSQYYAVHLDINRPASQVKAGWPLLSWRGTTCRGRWRRKEMRVRQTVAGAEDPHTMIS